MSLKLTAFQQSQLFLELSQRNPTVVSASVVRKWKQHSRSKVRLPQVLVFHFYLQSTILAVVSHD
jgi:hypothetical protein